jgi:glycosyltransferase involved in cell wall biosynthesis
VNPERLGYTRNFLAAARSCRGSYIAFCDQDDIWAPEKLARVAAALAKSHRKPDLILHTCRLLSGEEVDPEVFPAYLQRPGTFGALELDPLCIVPGHSIVARRDLVELASRFLSLLPEGVFVGRGHDDLTYFLGTVAGTTEVLDGPLVLWRQHSGNTCGVPRSAGVTRQEFQQPHLEFLRSHAAKWSALAQALGELAKGGDAFYSSGLARASGFFESRARFFTLRGHVSDPAVAYGSRIKALFGAHLSSRRVRGSGRREVLRNLLRDLASLLLGPQRLEG